MELISIDTSIIKIPVTGIVYKVDAKFLVFLIPNIVPIGACAKPSSQQTDDI